MSGGVLGEEEMVEVEKDEEVVLVVIEVEEKDMVEMEKGEVVGVEKIEEGCKGL